MMSILQVKNPVLQQGANIRKQNAPVLNRGVGTAGETKPRQPRLESMMHIGIRPQQQAARKGDMIGKLRR
jgi:hypothetical protein